MKLLKNCLLSKNGVYRYTRTTTLVEDLKKN